MHKFFFCEAKAMGNFVRFISVLERLLKRFQSAAVNNLPGEH